MNERRPTNSELRLSRLDDEDARREKEQGIFELFPKEELELPDEDAPLARDDAEE
jgi:hypothetical protein